MSERPTVKPDFEPVPLSEQGDAILRELALAKERLPKLAMPGPKGRQPRMHWGTVHQRIREYRSMTLTILTIERYEREGRLPPDLLAELHNQGQG